MGVRDLGTNLRGLRVLWVARCSLQDLGGVSSLPVLEELYFSFNDVRELSPLYAHDALQVVDLEGNLVDDFEEITSLVTLPSLRELTLNLNPVTQNEGFSRQLVLQTIPQLEMLDDLPASDGGLGHPADIGSLTASDTASDFDGDHHVAGPAADKLVLEDIPQGLGSESHVIAEDLVQGRALQELRERCQLPDVSLVRPMDRPDTGELRAIAELRARRAELESGGCSDQLREDCEIEPSDQDLIVEGLKRAPKPAPSLWTRRSPKNNGSHEAVSGTLLGSTFSPGDRRCRKGAWSSSVSSSTAYRPTTASSSTTRDDGSTAAVSELTNGEDGGPLVGNPLEAIRRRRRSTASGAQAAAADMGIRNLMRRYGEGGNAGLQDATAAVGPRVATPDVRIGPGRPSTPAGLLAQFEKRKARPLTSASCASLPGAGPLCEVAPRCVPKAGNGYVSSETPPTFATGDGEVLLLE